MNLSTRRGGGEFALRIALFLTLLCPWGVIAQQKQEVRGVVRDASGQLPLVGATVQLKGSFQGVTTEPDGSYSLKAAKGDVLVFSFIGYLPQELAYDGQASLDVALREDVAGIDEVVVIGYGKTTKKEITGSVASLKTGDLNKGSYTNAGGLLQGKVAGLVVTNPNGGDPNGQFSMLLRGNSTFMADQNPLFIIDGIVAEDIRNIDYNDVESIDVLKDGSAAAIYGTRGTNGVVIITTKRARQGTTSVEYDGQVSVQTVARRPMPMSAKEYSWAIRNFYPSSANSIGSAETDWFDQITRTPISHKHSLAVSGGSQLFSHRTVLSIEQNQGLQRKNDADKYLIRTNIHQQAFQGWLDLDYNAYFSKRKYSTANYDAFRQAFFHNPTEPVYDNTDPATGGYSRTIAMDYHNPVAMINERQDENMSDSFGASVRATLNILPAKGLKWDNFFSYRQNTFEGRLYRTKYYPSLIGQDGKAEISNSHDNSLQWESTLNYARDFGRHNLQVLLGYTYEEAIEQSSGMENYGFDNDLFLTNNIGAGSALGQGNAYMSSFKQGNRYIAFFGRVIYNYDERYLFSASLRRDGSTRFGANNKWGWFPAVSAGWRISREQFLRDAKWLDELKLRAGYGMTGNQGFPNYKSLTLIKPKGYYYYNGQWMSAYGPVSNPNPDLGWEKKSEFNVGLDFSFFGGRLNGTVDYYNRRIKDLVYDYTVPVGAYVFDKMFDNVGVLRNSGIEVMLAATPVTTKNFRWDTSFTVSHNKNVLVRFTNEEYSGTGWGDSWLNTPMGVDCQRLIEGESVGTFYAPVWKGVVDGKDTFEGSIAGNVPKSAWKNAGSAYPDAVIGWSNTLSYKGWDLSFMFRASIGGKVFNSYRAEFENINYIGLKNILASWLDDTSFTDLPTYSTKYIEDASYLKLDNLSLGYNVKFKSKFIQNLRFTLTAQNLWCVTGYKGVDPEVSLMGLAPGIESTSYYPRTTIVTFGINAKF